MSDTKQMLHAIINGQSSLKQEMLAEFKKVRAEIKRVDLKVEGVKSEVLKNRKRIDKLGVDLAELSDDAPTVDEFEKLEKRVSKVKKTVAPAA